MQWLARTFENDPYGPMRLPAVVDEAEIIEERGRRRLPPPAMARQPHTPRFERIAKISGVAAAILLAGLALRAPIMAVLPLLPSMNGLPASAQSLAFNQVRSELLRIHGVETLLVDGEVVNSSDVPVSLPAIRVTISSQEGTAVRTWLVEPAQDTVRPGGSVRFRSALASPPDAAREITLNLERRVDRADGV